jgi:OOP family OmpA-OmpF porin
LTYTGDSVLLNPSAVVPVKLPLTDTLRLGDVLFDFNKADLKPEAVTVLSSFFSKTELENIDSIIVEGHTDSIGTMERNQELSLQRSNAVAKWLGQLNIVLPHQIQTRAFGKSRPIASNTTTEGRAANRRVEIIIFRKEL